MSIWYDTTETNIVSEATPSSQQPHHTAFEVRHELTRRKASMLSCGANILGANFREKFGRPPPSCIFKNIWSLFYSTFNLFLHCHPLPWSAYICKCSRWPLQLLNLIFKKFSATVTFCVSFLWLFSFLICILNYTVHHFGKIVLKRVINSFT